MSKTTKIIAMTVMLVLPLRATAAVEVKKFTSQELSKLDKDLDMWATDATKLARVNQGYDTIFKILLSIVAILSLVFSVLAARYEKSPTPWLIKGATIFCTGLTTILSGIAHTDFNFAHRQEFWQCKANIYTNYRYELLYTNPDKEPFIKKVIDLGEKIESQQAPCPAPPGPAKAPEPPKS